MSLMDAEALLDTIDGSCSFAKHRRDGVDPLALINDTETTAMWPTACLLFAYRGLRDERYRRAATETADWIISMQASDGPSEG